MVKPPIHINLATLATEKERMSKVGVAYLVL